MSAAVSRAARCLGASLLGQSPMGAGAELAVRARPLGTHLPHVHSDQEQEGWTPENQGEQVSRVLGLLVGRGCANPEDNKGCWF